MRTRRKILILGHGGMLGSVASAYFRKAYEVRTVAVRFDPNDPESFLGAVRSTGADVVLNCIGAIKQRTVDVSALMAVNAYLPRLLRRELPSSVLLVHPSTDCVFDGKKGLYAAEAVTDAADAYGISKALGESVKDFASTVVIRCSIVGPDPGGRATGLLGWFLAQPTNAKVNGFVDHLWNGVTTLEWCRIVDSVLLGQAAVAQGHVLQPGTERIHSKHEMLLMFRDVFRPDVEVTPVSSGVPVDRSLAPTVAVPPLAEQLRDLAEYVKSGVRYGGVA